MKRWLPVSLIVLLLAALIGWRIHQKQSATTAQNAQQKARTTAAALVQTATATRRDIVQTYETVGTVEAPTIVNLAPQISGRLLFLAPHEGDVVHAGDILARIDTAEVDAAVRGKQAAVAGAEERLAQAQATQASTGVGIGSDILTKRAALTTARATQAQAQADMQQQIGAAQAAVTQAQAQIDAANAAIGTANAAINSAKATLANDVTNQERQEDLYKEGATAKANVDNARTQAEVARAAVEQANQQRRNAEASRQTALAAKRAAQNQAEIAANKARTDVAAARAGVGQANAALTASQANRASIPAYQNNLNALQAAVAAANADERAAEAQRSYATITAPITGVVTQRNSDPGSVATPGQPLLTIQAIRQVWVSAGVDESATRDVYQGMDATVTFDALPGKTYRGKIVQANPAADAQSRQFTVRIRLDNPGYTIKPGMFGQVKLVTKQTPQVVAVPREAVTFDSGDRNAETGAATPNGDNGSGGGDSSGADSPSAAAQAAPADAGGGGAAGAGGGRKGGGGGGKKRPAGPTVTVVGADNKAEVRPVVTGASDARFIEIVRGLQPGEKVVTLAARAVRDGQLVRTGGGAGGGGRRGGGAGGGNSDNGGGSANGAGTAGAAAGPSATAAAGGTAR